MSLIQKIRDKYARIAVIAIGLALLGFILMDAFAGRGGIFGSRDTTIGKINGDKIEADVFMRRVSEITKCAPERKGKMFHVKHSLAHSSPGSGRGQLA